MKREFLKELGLPDDQIEKIMAENGKDIAAEVAKAKDSTAAAEDLKKQIAERDKDLAELKKAANDNEDSAKKIADLQTKYKADTEALIQQLADQKRDAAIDAAIAAAKGRNSKAIKALLDPTKLKLKDDGTVEGLDLEALKKSDAYLFELESTKDEGGNPGAGSSGGGAAITQDLFSQKINDVAWVQANMEAVTKGLADGTLKKG